MARGLSPLPPPVGRGDQDFYRWRPTSWGPDFKAFPSRSSLPPVTASGCGGGTNHGVKCAPITQATVGNPCSELLEPRPGPPHPQPRSSRASGFFPGADKAAACGGLSAGGGGRPGGQAEAAEQTSPGDPAPRASRTPAPEGSQGGGDSHVLPRPPVSAGLGHSPPPACSACSGAAFPVLAVGPKSSREISQLSRALKRFNWCEFTCQCLSY